MQLNLPNIFLFAFLFTFISLNGAAQEKEISSALDAEVEAIINQHYYTNPDTALFKFRKIANKAAQHQLWHKYLDIITYMAWCADYHKNIDSLTHYLAIGERVYSQHQLNIDSLDPEGLRYANILYTKGMFYYAVGDFSASINIFDKLRASGLKVLSHDSLLVYDIYSNLGNAYYNLENYQKADLYHQMAGYWLPNQHESYGQPYDKSYFQALTLQNSGKCKLPEATIGTFETANATKARDLFMKSLQMLMPFKDEVSYKNAILSNLNLLVSWHLNNGSFDSTTFYIKQMLPLVKEDTLQLISYYRYWGDAYLQSQQYKKAKDCYTRSYTFTRAVFLNKHYRIAIPLYKIGEVFARQKQWTEALKNYQLSLTYLVKDFNNEQDVLKNPALEKAMKGKELFETLFLKANALFQLYNENHNPEYLIAASDTYQLLIQLLEDMRLIFPSTEYQQFLAAKSQEVFEKAIETNFVLYQTNSDKKNFLNNAFKLIEKNKSRILLETLKNSHALNFADIPQSILSKERNLKRKLSFLENELYNASQEDVERIANLQTELLHIKKNYQELIEILEKKFPNYYSLKYSHNKPFSIEAVQSQLTDQQAVVCYFYGKENLYSFFITTDQTFIQKVSIGQIENALKQLITTASKPITEEKNHLAAYKKYIENGYLLYQKLIQPAISNSNTNIEELIIIPDGLLFHLPFEILLTNSIQAQATSFTAYHKLPYLIKQQAVGYLYSATMLIENYITPHNTTSISYLGFAPSYKGGNTLKDEILQSTPLPDFPPLKHNSKEVMYAADLFNGLSFTGKEATKAMFKEKAGVGKLLHLSMHAFANNENPMYSGLVFEKDSLADDPILYSHELYNLSLQADLAILSACETGAGKALGGEGLMSLGRSFMYAGCPSITMSLWKVNDLVSQTITKAYCKNLKAGMNKAGALRAAKLDFLNKADYLTSNPYFWASFVSYGNNESLFFTETDYRFRMLATISSTIALCLLALAGVKRKG